MRTGLTTVYATECVDLGDHVDTWEGDDGVVAYGYDSVTLAGTESATGVHVAGATQGTVSVGDLVRVENIPMGHRKHTHEQWAVAPVWGIWAVPRDKEQSEDGGCVETIELDAREFTPESTDGWPGAAVVCEVYAPRLGGDVPLSRCSPVGEPPAAYVERYGDDRSEGLWVRDPIRKDDRLFNDDHLPEPEEDDRDAEYVGTDGAYDTHREMRADMYALPADDENAPSDNPETLRPYQVVIEDDHLAVELLDGRGEQRMRDVAAEYGAEVEQTGVERRGGIGADEVVQYCVRVG